MSSHVAASQQLAATYISGGGGNRTRVPRHFSTAFYVRSRDAGSNPDSTATFPFPCFYRENDEKGRKREKEFVRGILLVAALLEGQRDEAIPHFLLFSRFRPFSLFRAELW